jgi:hypothetical protein
MGPNSAESDSAYLKNRDDVPLQITKVIAILVQIERVLEGIHRENATCRAIRLVSL